MAWNDAIARVTVDKLPHWKHQEPAHQNVGPVLRSTWECIRSSSRVPQRGGFGDEIQHEAAPEDLEQHPQRGDGERTSTPSNRSPMMNAEPADSPMPTLWRKRTVGKPQIESDSETQVGTDRLCSHSKNDSMHGPVEEAPQTTRAHTYHNCRARSRGSTSE